MFPQPCLSRLHASGPERVSLSCAGAKKLGHKVGDLPFFDTVRINVGDADKVVQAAVAEGCNLRKLDGSTITVSLDETTRIEDINQLFKILNGGSAADFSAESLASEVDLLLHMPRVHGPGRCWPAKTSMYLSRQAKHADRAEPFVQRAHV